MPLTTAILGFKKPDAGSGDHRVDLYNAIRDNADLAEALLDRRGYAEVLTSQTTAAVGPVDLATPGPSVSITVPTNGIVEILAAVDITGSGAAAGNVFLLEDGGSLGNILARTTASSVPVYTVPGTAVGSTARSQAAWLSFPVAAGSHTYKLQYGSNSGGALPFANRRLWVRVRTF